MQTHTYLTDLSDGEWGRIEPLLPAAHTGRPRHHSLRTVVNALLYVLRTGCAWHLLPADWPPWQTVYYCLRKWRLDGTLERIHTLLRDELRIALGRDYERLCARSETWIYLAMIRLMLRRLVRMRQFPTGC